MVNRSNCSFFHARLEGVGGGAAQHSKNRTAKENYLCPFGCCDSLPLPPSYRSESPAMHHLNFPGGNLISLSIQPRLGFSNRGNVQHPTIHSRVLVVGGSSAQV